LKDIQVPPSSITAEGLRALQGMQQLQSLHLSQIKVTSKEVEILKTFSGLKNLILSNCALSAEDSAVLKAALPKTALNIFQ
jgi:hypothetical protein